jgi:molybdate/tungstate transport system substrate-binding protein
MILKVKKVARKIMGKIVIKQSKEIVIKIIILFLFNGFVRNYAFSKEKLVIFHAGSLSYPFKRLEERFEKIYPFIDVLRESSGSRLASFKVRELNRYADIVAVSDYNVIEDILIPEYTKWYICFATNQMVIMYHKGSKYADKINSRNWPEILLKKEVRYGHSDPHLDPCGYRTKFVWQLSEKYYKFKDLYKLLIKNCPSKNIRPKETDLIALLEAGELDYIFIYSSIATQHHFPFIRLPEKINLGNPKYKKYYAQASLKIRGIKPNRFTKVSATPIVYALTIPKNAKNRKSAYRFIDFLLSKEGRNILKASGQPPLVPAITNALKYIPERLRRNEIVGR